MFNGWKLASVICDFRIQYIFETVETYIVYESVDNSKSVNVETFLSNGEAGYSSVYTSDSLCDKRQK